ncbi:hypothetical protein AMS68_005998 [Peltaster fructicola]|uniref:Nucleoporin NUP37 n=1 Tax=Peltaster fructicola TaxID=286661 RepID=A0A6H0Y0N4_9PEZI|nr:hypothetical protein AMS68_005998 [Peltaster fructicola]
MEPRVTKREKKLLLAYDLSSRIRCSAIYPQPAPNGSSIIFYGHDNGLKALWRGGRKLRSPSQRSATQQDSDIMEFDQEDQSLDLANGPNKYEDQEEELDADHPYHSILYTLDFKLDSAVSKIVIPTSITGQGLTDHEHGTIVVATLKGSIYVLDVPLAPPADNRAKAIASSVLRKAVQLKHDGTYVRCLAAKEADSGLIVAAYTRQLELWQSSQEPDKTKSAAQHTIVPYTGACTSIAFHPALRSRQFVVTDRFGSATVYEASVQSTTQSSGPIYSLYTPFEAQSENSSATPSRKRLLATQFILGGRCIIALVENGQWGIWDTTASQPGKSLEQFVLSGYLETAVASEVHEPAVARRTSSSLTPMTPNTRKTKSSEFFSAPRPRPEGEAATGGISVSRTSSTAGVPDESVMIWHNNEIFSIPSVQSFWQRSTSGSGGLGTLYTPGIARIPGINLFNETITSISQFAAGTAASGIGQLRTQRDILVSAEYRFVITQNRASPTDPFSQAQPAESKDLRMLDAGELDLGGVDRILGNMDGRSRKVGFVH